MRYRLKKDTPEFKAGSVFTRRKYEYGDYDDDCLFADISPGVSPVPAFDISLIDNFDEWFEEVKEPKWVRKCVKGIECKREGVTVFIRFKFIKDFYTWFLDRAGDDKIDEIPEGWEDEFAVCERYSSDADKLFYLNQLIRDGYIEIEDNPNIVWEDENEV